LSLFVALSLADLALTRFLLERQGGGSYEWNPVASWWLDQFGWVGLIGFKLGVVLLVAALTLIVSRHRPRTAGRVLGFGCAALLTVIVHSGLLVPGVLAEADYNYRLEAHGRLLERQLVHASTYTNLINDLGKDLVSRRRSLGEAVDVLSSTGKAQDPQWLSSMAQRYPGFSAREQLGARLIDEALIVAPGGTYGLAELYRELNAQFRSCFGRAAPQPTMIYYKEVEYPG
jgi:hypothetical protein